MITKKISEKARVGASAILEIKITEIENAVAEKNKEIYPFTIPYLNLSGSLMEYLPDKKINNLNLRYKNSISKYWEQKNEKKIFN